MKEEKLKSLKDIMRYSANEVILLDTIKQELGMKRILAIRRDRDYIQKISFMAKVEVLMEIFDITPNEIKEEQAKAEEQDKLRVEDQIIADLDAERTIAEADAEAQARGEAEDKANAEYDARDELESQEDKYYEEHHQ